MPALARTAFSISAAAVSKICELEVSRVGLREAEARELGFDVVAATIRASTKAHYAPGAGPVHVKVVAERGTEAARFEKIPLHVDQHERASAHADRHRLGFGRK